MKIHEFTIILNTEITDDVAEHIYSTLDDGTLATICGVAQITFHREGYSLEIAILSAINVLKTLGISIAKIEIQPESVLIVLGCARRFFRIDGSNCLRMRLFTHPSFPSF